MKILVTGGAGFIGSALVRHIIAETAHEVINVDKLTHAGNLDSLAPVAANRRYRFERADICDVPALNRLFDRYEPDAVMHLAVETPIDRSIDGHGEFIQTNVVGTYTLLEAARRYWSGRPRPERDRFRFHHVSTDEVYGSLGPNGRFIETTPYDPSSPYSASKASSDHLVRAWQRTFGLPVLVTSCSNNYGPFQFPEKLIPLMVLNGLAGKPLPVHGENGPGNPVCDWLYVEDHARALVTVLERGEVGATYNIGGCNERTNRQVVDSICTLLDELTPHSFFTPHASLIALVKDRSGHDRRQAVDASKIERELGWRPTETFESGLRKTVQWYLDNPTWCRRAVAGRYGSERPGVKAA